MTRDAPPRPKIPPDFASPALANVPDRDHFGSLVMHFQGSSPNPLRPNTRRARTAQMLDEVVGNDAVVLLFVVVPHLVEPRAELFEDRAIADARPAVNR